MVRSSSAIQRRRPAPPLLVVSGGSVSRGSGPGNRVRTMAYVLSRVPYGESDLIVHLFTEALGKISALARGARRSQKRFGGSLEPIHTLQVEVTDKPSSDLCTLHEAHLSRARTAIIGNLECLEAAGKALVWLRRSAPGHTPEPKPFLALTEFLDELDQGKIDTTPQGHVAAFGLRLLEGLGFGLCLDRCISCAKACPEEAASLLSPEKGGLICRACGGGPIRLDAASRRALSDASEGRLHSLSPELAPLGIRLVERALGAHMDIG